MSLLDVEHVHLKIGGLNILDDVSFAVGDGEFFAVIGPNGAGKTSLLNVLCRVYSATDGDVTFDGRSLLTQRRDDLAGLGIARTFQNLALFEHMDVLDNVILGRHNRMRSGLLSGAWWVGRARREEIRGREECWPLIELMDLTDYVGEPITDLPYGIKKRIELARALAVQPKLLLLDEPAAGMNDEETADLGDWILLAKKELGLTVVMIEHDMGLVQRLADRALVLDFGHVLTVESPREAIADPRVIEAYLGVSSIDGEDAS